MGWGWGRGWYEIWMMMLLRAVTIVRELLAGDEASRRLPRRGRVITMTMANAFVVNDSAHHAEVRLAVGRILHARHAIVKDARRRESRGIA